MPDPQQAIAGTFVEPRGLVEGDDHTPIERGQIAYVAVFDDDVAVLRVRRGALKPKPTGEVMASARRTDVSAAGMTTGRLAGMLEVTFTDGRSWAFDIPRVHLPGAERVVDALR
jgi:hypothetical protein